MDNATEATPMFTESRFTASKPTIPSAIETQQALIDNIFDEISRIEDRLTPFLGHFPMPSGENDSAREAEDPSLSPILDNLMNNNSKLERAMRLINGIASRVDS